MQYSHSIITERQSDRETERDIGQVRDTQKRMGMVQAGRGGQAGYGRSGPGREA